MVPWASTGACVRVSGSGTYVKTAQPGIAIFPGTERGHWRIYATHGGFKTIATGSFTCYKRVTGSCWGRVYTIRQALPVPNQVCVAVVVGDRSYGPACVAIHRPFL